MSHVTNAILSFGILEDARARMGEVNAALAELDGRGQQFGDDIGNLEDAYGGHKFLEAPLYVAAFNHFTPDRILVCVALAVWQHPDDVQLIVQDQHDDVFSILTLPATWHVPGGGLRYDLRG